jgi:hypothetical protein
MTDHFPPDDDLGPEMTPEEAFARAMRVKLRRNREARAALKASGKSAQPSEPSETPVGPVSAEELDQAILDRHPGLTKEKLARMMNEA